MHTKLLFLLLSTMLTPLAVASDMKLEPTCHRLMTEKECSDHQSRLATLPPGEALNLYLAEYASTQKERESACSYKRDLTSKGTRPLQQQVLLRYY